MTHLNYSLKEPGKTFELPKTLLKSELNHDDIDGDNYKNKKDIWLPYVKMDVLSTSFCYARYCGAFQEITKFSMKDFLSLPGLGFKYFNSLRTDRDGPIYTYNDKYTRHFVRQAAYGGRVCAFNQYYKSNICDDILHILSKELIVEGNTYEKIEAYMNYKNEHLKLFEKEYESQFDDYRDENEEEKDNFINEKLGQLPIHQLLKQLSLNALLWSFDASSLYPSAMWDPKSIYLKIETGYPFTIDMNGEFVTKFNNQTFTQGSAILKFKYYNPKNINSSTSSSKRKSK